MVPVTRAAKGIFRVGLLETGHTGGPISPYIVKGKERPLASEPGEDLVCPRRRRAGRGRARGRARLRRMVVGYRRRGGGRK